MSILTKASTLLALLIITGCTVQEPKQTKYDHPHSHAAHKHATTGHHHAPHMGIVIPFYAKQANVGFAELKLHDDKGDLELWLTKNEAGTKPFDLPLNSAIKVSFLNLDTKGVELHIRNNKKNEDEEGKGNIRNNKTNYFIFPGNTGNDASFLMGKDFTAETIISFKADGTSYTTNPFKLYPHTH